MLTAGARYAVSSAQLSICRSSSFDSSAMSFIGDLFTQSIAPANDTGWYDRTKQKSVQKSTPRRVQKSTTGHSGRPRAKPQVTLPRRSTPQTRPFPLKNVKREPASRATRGTKKNPIQTKMHQERPVHKKIRVKTEPISQGALQKVPSCERARVFQMCMPGGVALGGEATSLNVQHVESGGDEVKESADGFLMVPTQSTDVGQQQVVCRGRKPKSEIACSDGKCGQCRRCRCRAYWDKSGARHAMEVMSVHGDKQYVWAAWKDDGVGCRLCFNFHLARGERPTPPGKMRMAKCPWANFKMLIFKKNSLLRHERTAQHRSAVAFHCTGSIVDFKAVPREHEIEASGRGESARGVPTVVALKRLVTAMQRGQSGKSFVAQERTKDEESFKSPESMWAGVRILAETLRQRWRLFLKHSKISVATDASGEVDAVTFQAFDGEKVRHGTFGLAQQHLAQGERLPKKSNVPDDKGAEALAKTVIAVIRAFCSERTGKHETSFNETLFNTICQSVLFMVSDGAPYAQLSGMLLCRNHFKKALGSEKDTVHDFMRITEEVAKKDCTWGPVRYELFSKKHAIIKDLHYAPTVKREWHEWQNTILGKEGHQSGSGPQQVCEIIRYMPYGPTRASVEADCLEVLCRTMKATLCTMADRASKGSSIEVQEAYRTALNTMMTAQWLRVGLNADKKIVERATLRRFDCTWSFLPMKVRIFEEHMRTQHVLVSNGALVSRTNNGTMTAVVVDTIKDNPRVSYGLQIRALSAEPLEQTLSAEVVCLQRQIRATNKLLDEHNNPTYMMNRSKCFDLHRWETIDNAEALTYPWRGRDATLDHGTHKAMLFDDFEYFCKLCNVTVLNARELFERWKNVALKAWKRKKKELPADEQREANYNGEIMLDSWLWTFRSFSDGARGLQCQNVFNALKPIVELIACLSRNTTPTERTLKAIKTLNNNEGPTRALEHMNDALLVKSYIAQDTTLFVDESCSFYKQFVENWLRLQGRTWCARKKRRSDAGKRHKYQSKFRFKKLKLHKMMWKCIDRLCTKYKQDGKRDQKALTGEDLTKLQEKMHGRTDDFSEQQTKYIKHHTEIGPDVKRRKLQERQRAKGTRWCQPGLQAVKKSKATNHRSLDETKQQLKVFFPRIFLYETP